MELERRCDCAACLLKGSAGPLASLPSGRKGSSAKGQPNVESRISDSVESLHTTRVGSYCVLAKPMSEGNPMAGTTTTNRIATLEDITRRCSAGIGTRAAILEDAIAHARQAAAQVAEAEQHISAGLASILTAKPVFVGNSEYMLTSNRLLGDLVSELESDVQELRAVHAGLAEYEVPTAEILEHLIAYSVDAIQSRIRARMNKLGGDFTVPAAVRTSGVVNHVGVPSRRRSEQPPARELIISDFEERVPMETLVHSGLDNFERGGELLESCFQDLEASQSLIANAIRLLVALNEKYRQVEELEIGSSAPRINEAIENLRRLIRDVDFQSDRLVYVSGASDRSRSPLLAIMENMGNLLLSGVLSELSPAESREITAREVLQKALKGDISELSGFNATASDAQREALTEALFHATRTRELEEASHAVDALKYIALMGAGNRTEASDKLLSLSNSLSVSEAVRGAATAALIDLTTDSDSSQ